MHLQCTCMLIENSELCLIVMQVYLKIFPLHNESSASQEIQFHYNGELRWINR